MAQRHRVRSSLSRPLLTSAVLAAMAAPAFAYGEVAGAPQTLDKVVVTASGFEQKVVDAPASISVVSREELSKRPYTNLVDALRDVEGIDVGLEATDKNGRATISMRGLPSEYTLVLIDGRRWMRSSASKWCAARCQRCTARTRWAA